MISGAGLCWQHVGGVGSTTTTTTMLYIVLAYLMLFAALTNSVCLNNASFFFLFKYFLCQGYELSGEIALKKK